MLGLFKKLFGKPAETATPPPPSATTAPNAAPASAAASKKTAPGPEDIIIPLKNVVPSLPDSLKKRLDKSLKGDEVVWINKDDAVKQLATGAVKLRFSEICQMSPGTFLTPDGDMMATMISLPLQDILPKIKALPRRAAQKQVEVPQDVQPVFGGGKEDASKAVKATSAVAATPAPTPAAAAPVNIPPPPAKPVPPPPSKPVPPAEPKPAEAYVPPTPKPLAPQEPISIKMPMPEQPKAPAPPPAPPVPKPVPPPPPAPAPAAQTPPPAFVPPPPQPASAIEGPTLSFGDIFGQPDKKDWTPQEVVEKAATLRGVAGALITTADGLPVAFHLPPNLSGNTVAAFVPQMYTRITQYTRDLKLGDARHLTILVEDVPLQIFRSGGVYFTALGRAKENLPKPQLTAIAAALGRQSPT